MPNGVREFLEYARYTRPRVAETAMYGLDGLGVRMSVRGSDSSYGKKSSAPATSLATQNAVGIGAMDSLEQNTHCMGF